MRDPRSIIILQNIQEEGDHACICAKAEAAHSCTEDGSMVQRYEKIAKIDMNCLEFLCISVIICIFAA